MTTARIQVSEITNKVARNAKTELFLFIFADFERSRFSSLHEKRVVAQRQYRKVGQRVRVDVVELLVPKSFKSLELFFSLAILADNATCFYVATRGNHGCRGIDFIEKGSHQKLGRGTAYDVVGARDSVVISQSLGDVFFPEKLGFFSRVDFFQKRKRFRFKSLGGDDFHTPHRRVEGSLKHIRKERNVTSQTIQAKERARIAIKNRFVEVV